MENKTARTKKQKNVMMLQIRDQDMQLRNKFEVIFKMDSEIDKKILNRLLEEMIYSAAPVWAVKTISDFCDDDSGGKILKSIFDI